MQQQMHIKYSLAMLNVQRNNRLEGLLVTEVSFKIIWRFVKVLALVQVFNAVMDLVVWFKFGYLVPSWTIAAISIFYVILVLALKRAQENDLKRRQAL
jgi:hypothetical protein